MKKIILSIILGSSLLFAQDFDYSGSLTTLAGAGLPYTEDNAGKFLAGQLAFDNLFKAYLNETIFYLNAVLVADGCQSQSSNGISSFVSDDGVFALKLKEAYFDYNGGVWALRAGRQITGWGKADGIQITDILCPQDESNMIAQTYKESRLGIDALRLSFMGDWIQSDFYWIPIFTPSTLPLAKKSPLRSLIFPSSYEGYELNNPTRQSDFSLPDLKLYNSEYAARVGMYFSKFDLSFYGFYGWDDLPFTSYNISESGKVNVNGEYKRMAMLGADAAIPAGDFVFRLESAFFPQRNIQTSASYQAARQKAEKAFDSSKKCEQLVSLLGFDWTPSGGWMLTFQYITDCIFNDSADLDRKKFQHQLSLTVEKGFFNENLNCSALAFLDLRDFSSTAEMSCEYNLSDAVKLGLVANLYFKGADGKNGLYGMYKDLSCLTLKGKVSF